LKALGRVIAKVKNFGTRVGQSLPTEFPFAR